jgi:phosphoribosyl-dephospho-CoA transferase
MVEASYAELGGAGAAVAQLEAEQSSLQARVSMASREVEALEQQLQAEAAAARVLTLQVAKLKRAASELSPQEDSSKRRCFVCQKTCKADGFREHSLQCVHKAVDFSVARAMQGR